MNNAVIGTGILVPQWVSAYLDDLSMSLEDIR